jgi:hypothetical protein
MTKVDDDRFGSPPVFPGDVGECPLAPGAVVSAPVAEPMIGPFLPQIPNPW